MERLPWAEGKSHLTTAYQWFLAAWARRLSWQQARWCLLKRPANLTDKETVKLAEVLKYNLQTVRAYLHREDFQRFWEYKSPT